MDIEEFNQMSLEQIKEFQDKNRAKVEKNRQRVKEQKARTHRLIVRGAIAEDFVPNAENLTDDEFIQKLYELIYQR